MSLIIIVISLVSFVGMVLALQGLPHALVDFGAAESLGVFVATVVIIA